jgi:MFS family permease
MNDQDSTTARLGPMWLAPGISRGNAWALMYSAFVTIGLLTFVAIGTPYVLNANLGIPVSEQGTISGDLALWNEIALLIVFSPIGVLADRFGRRQIFAAGLIIMGIGYACYAFAGSVGELTVYRVIYAIGLGAATGILGTVVADYPQEKSRGKLVAITGVLNGLGVIVVTLVIGRLPRVFAERGVDEVWAGRYTHLIVFGICLVSAIVIARGLAPGTPVKQRERPAFGKLLRDGLAAVRNPRIVLAYACGFIARSDLVVLGTFTVLWGTTAAIQQGVEPSEALARGRIPFAIAQTAALLWLPIIGFIMDRLNRVTGLILCMSLAAFGYLSMLFVTDPLASASTKWWVILGIGQISAFFGATTLIGQEAPIRERGSVIGVFNIFGAIGILFSTGVGGRMFDGIGPSAPFALIGSMTLLVLAGAVYVRITAPGPMPQRA